MGVVLLCVFLRLASMAVSGSADGSSPPGEEDVEKGVVSKRFRGTTLECYSPKKPCAVKV